MADGPVIGVLTLSVSCDYFGSILGGVARAAAAEGGRMITIQTVGAGTFDFDSLDPPQFGCPVAWRHISAFIVILNSVPLPYLEAIGQSGKPVVMISHEMPGFSCPVVLPDNRTGVREAVLHLVEHGHRDIAFAGFLEVRDLCERYEAYQNALLECGITPRPDLYFDTLDNRETGGERAARAMLARGLPSTAVVTGNDLNAIGMMRTLLSAGLQLPRQQAIVGFDDLDGVVYLTPSLSTVRQRFESLGHTAATLALRALAGEEVESRTWYVPTSFQPRESCGCPDPLTLSAVLPAQAPEIRRVEQLVAAMSRELPLGGSDPGQQADIARGVDVLARSLGAAANGVAGPNPLELRQELTALRMLYANQPEGMVRMMRHVRQFGLYLAEQAGGRDPDAACRVRSGTEDVLVALAQSQSRVRPVIVDEFLTKLKMLYTVSKNLLCRRESDPRDLSWIKDTNARGGCLGLWSNGPDLADRTDETLWIATIFRHDEGRVSTPDTRVPAESFPPAEFVELADLSADEMVYVAPLTTGTSDWGMLALVAPIEAGLVTGREMMNQWAALLTIALEHEAVLKSLHEQKELLRHAALYDPLTGLPNRTLFLSQLEQAISTQAEQPDYRFSVVLLDLDGFKLVNDSLGHLAGDELLVRVAERIRASTGDADVAARFGGDEFAILVSQGDRAEAGSDGQSHPNGGGDRDPVAMAERIRAALEVPFRLGEEEVVVSASIGISLSTNGYQHAEDLIRDADTAMYTAKWQRKGSHAVFDVAMHDRVVSRLRTEAELRRALETGAFELLYQPIVRLDDGHACAFEALLRWRHPVRGLVPPDEFLPIAEDSGLMPPIGRWVLTESCRQMSAWRASGAAPDDLRISVNVSNRQFWHTKLLEDVEESLHAAELDPSALIIEITEGVIMNDVSAAHRKLAALHDMGVRLHIDDFGTGYSSLAALHRLTIDAFKIDRSFVAPLDVDGRSRELVRSIISMGVNLGLDLVAEGIETTQQRDHLRGYGCHHGQGYLFSQPVCAEQASAALCGGRVSQPAG